MEEVWSSGRALDGLEDVDEPEGELEGRARALAARDFRAWVGTENYEMRVAPDGAWVDERVLEIDASF